MKTYELNLSPAEYARLASTRVPETCLSALDAVSLAGLKVNIKPKSDRKK